jgi:acetylornithine/N-succinyldiaminopimelate aminotransferase
MDTEFAYTKDCLMAITPRPDIADAGPEIVTAARGKGLLLNAPRPHCLRFMPALNGTPAEVEEGLGLMRKILKELQ